MSAGTQVTLQDSVRSSSDEISPDEWRRLYEEYDGCIADISRVVERAEKTVRKRLSELQIHEIESFAPQYLEDKLPQDVGLSPLGCGECGAVDIVNHPCPECDWDPRQNGDGGEH